MGRTGITIYLDPIQQEQLEGYAASKGVSCSAIVRALLGKAGIITGGKEYQQWHDRGGYWSNAQRLQRKLNKIIAALPAA